MKKKGLIVATIVMVLVLAVSLTTATYAWFTTTATSSITNITVSVAGGSDVLIGLTTTGTYVSQNVGNDSFVSGTCAYSSDGTWSSETPGMTATINTGLSLATIQKAVCTSSAAAATATTSTIDDADDQLTGTHFVKASGQGATITGAFEDANENGWPVEGDDPVEGDYLHFTIGLLAGKASVDTITLNITVVPTDTKQSLGMTAALHVMYKVDNGTLVNNDCGGNKTQGDSKTSLSSASTFGGAGIITDTTHALYGTSIGAGWSNYPINFGTTGTSMGTAAANIHQVEIWIYYVGTDEDCVSAALGSGATVYFNVLNTNTAVLP